MRRLCQEKKEELALNDEDYAKGRRGELKGFTGIDSTYEPPTEPYLRIATTGLSVAAAVDQLYAAILPVIHRPTS